MAQTAWQRPDGMVPVASLGHTSSHAGGARRSGTWGPSAWPAEVRDNVDAWPPTFRERQLLADIRRPLDRPCRVAIVSNKDGVGKSTAARILQAIFTAHRADKSVVVAASPESPGYRVHAESPGTVRGAVERIGSGTDAPLAPPPDTDFGPFIELLGSPYAIVLCDVASNLSEESTRQILDRCDLLVVVATPAVDGLYAASACLDDLRLAGYEDLADRAVCVINRIRPMPFSDLVTIDRHFARRCAEVVRVPWDTRVGQELSQHLDELRPTTRTGFYELAAAIVRGLTTSAKPREGEEEL